MWRDEIRLGHNVEDIRRPVCGETVKLRVAVQPGTQPVDFAMIFSYRSYPGRSKFIVSNS